MVKQTIAKNPWLLLYVPSRLGDKSWIYAFPESICAKKFRPPQKNPH